MKKPRVSIAIPYYAGMKNSQFFLDRCLASIRAQTFQDYEIVITDKGGMAENTNNAIKQCTGELIKILFMDDMFAHDNALKDIVQNFKENDNWIITGCSNNLLPRWTVDVEKGNNKLGSPSCLTFRNKFKDNFLFDEKMSFFLDCDYYKRLYEKYGEPKILRGNNVIIGIGEHQHSNVMTNEEKLAEYKYIREKYDMGAKK